MLYRTRRLIQRFTTCVQQMSTPLAPGASSLIASSYDLLFYLLTYLLTNLQTDQLIYLQSLTCFYCFEAAIFQHLCWCLLKLHVLKLVTYAIIVSLLIVMAQDIDSAAALQ